MLYVLLFLACIRSLYTDDGRITSSGYPYDSSYAPGLNCNTTIVAPTGYNIQFYFKEFNVEQHPNCDYDYVQVIYDVFIVMITRRKP